MGPGASARGAENEVLQNFGLLLQGRRLKWYEIAEKCYKIAEKSYKNGPRAGKAKNEKPPNLQRPVFCICHFSGMRPAGPLPIHIKSGCPKSAQETAATDEPDNRQAARHCLLYHIREPGRKDGKQKHDDADK